MSSRKTFLLLCIGLISQACGEETGSQDQRMVYIEEKVEERMADYKQILEERCQERVLEEASRRADSILLVRARLERDTVGKPPKPYKPEKPTVKTLIDSIPVAPLFKDSLSGS